MYTIDGVARVPVEALQAEGLHLRAAEAAAAGLHVRATARAPAEQLQCIRGVLRVRVEVRVRVGGIVLGFVTCSADAASPASTAEGASQPSKTLGCAPPPVT